MIFELSQILQQFSAKVVEQEGVSILSKLLTITINSIKERRGVCYQCGGGQQRVVEGEGISGRQWPHICERVHRIHYCDMDVGLLEHQILLIN